MAGSTVSCPQCGAQVAADNRFCEGCGVRMETRAAPPSPIAAEERARPGRSKERTTAPNNALSWEYDMPIINNRFVLWDMGMLFAVCMALFQGMIFVMGLLVDGEPAIWPAEVYGYLLVTFFTLFVIVVIFAYRNRFHQTYTINANGLTVPKKLRWRDVHKVTVHQGPRVIALSNSWRVVQRIYCTPENFAAVLERVQAYKTAGARRGSRPRTAKPTS